MTSTSRCTADLDYEPLRIAPKPDGDHWTVDDYLALDFDKEEDWQTAITIFEHRIRGRFLSQVEVLENSPDRNTRASAGFAIMALDCLLIETLQQFREGVAETPRNRSMQYFQAYLTQTEFGEFFDLDMADMFYRSIRCGILHQAEIKGNSRILIRKRIPLVDWAEDRGGLIIQRLAFHKQLECIFHKYVSRLRRNDPPDEMFRQCLRRKMDSICGADPAKFRLGILAYGSLNRDPGTELRRHIIDELQVETPFAVEFARSSNGRAGAPTLVPVSSEYGSSVRARVLVLDADTTEAQANDMLYRREINCLDEAHVRYGAQRQRDKDDAVVIERIQELAGVETVLYTSLSANIDTITTGTASNEEKVHKLAQLAIESVTRRAFCSQRDGIRYLNDAIRHGIHTPLTKQYRAAVLHLSGDAPDLDTARLRIARQKGLIPESKDE